MNQVSSDNGSGQPDGIPLRQLLKLAVRTVPYLKSARADLRRLLKGFLISLPLLLGLLVAGLLAADLFFNRMLRGQPVTPFEARLLSLDPALFVDVGALGVEARRVLRTKLMIYIGVLIAVYTPLIVGGLFYFIRLVQRINQGLRTQMMAQVQAMSMRHHSGSRVGDSIYHAYQDSAMVTGLMAMLVAPILPLLRATWFLFFVLIFDWRLSVALGAMYLIGILFARHQGPFLRAEFRRARELNAALTSRIQETLSGLKVVKAFGSEAFEQRRFEDASEGAFGGAFHARSRLALYRIVAFSLSAVPVMGAYCLLAVYAAEERSLAAGTALAFTGFATWNLGAWNYALGRMRNAGSAAKGLMDMWGLSQDMSVAMERAFSQVDLTPEVQDAEDAVEMPGLEREVRFEDVSFAYQPERPVLSDVSVTAKAGQITALVGPTGSGKSTLVSLLLRLFDPDAGRVAIDDQDIRRFTIDSLRSRIAIALQENLLFGTTIRENIRYAVPDADDARVREAAAIACADEFIEKQPQGYDTPLGERGTRLSTGQRQRLSIARAIIKDTPILVLDEPTASLDAETELKVLSNLHRWGQGRAIFLITHRLSTIRQADHIVYLREGRVVEQGSHAELMAREGGAYRRFVELEQGHDRAPASEAPEAPATEAVS